MLCSAAVPPGWARRWAPPRSRDEWQTSPPTCRPCACRCCAAGDPPDHQAQLPSDGREGHPPHHQGGLLPRSHRPARRAASSGSAPRPPTRQALVPPPPPPAPARTRTWPDAARCGPCASTARSPCHQGTINERRFIDRGGSIAALPAGPVLVDIPKDVQQTLDIPDWGTPMSITAYMSRLPGPPQEAQLEVGRRPRGPGQRGGVG